MKEQYSQKDIYSDLLDHSAKMLKPGGRVVFLWHIDDERTPEENKIPENDFLEFVNSSKDSLTKTRARLLITLKKKKS